MHHRVFGRHFSRTTNERRRLFQGLVRDLIRYGKIKTTIHKAKAVQPIIEKLITKAKAGTEMKKAEINEVIVDISLTNMLIKDGRTRFSKRTSGYTRIVRLGTRSGDRTEEALLMFVDPQISEGAEEAKTDTKKDSKNKQKDISKVMEKGKKKGK